MNSRPPESDEAYQRLEALLKELGGALLAFSGGVDSSLLLAAAREALGDSVLAVTATSPTFPSHELESARRLAAKLGVRWITLETQELDDPQFTENPPNRCYFCKKKLFSQFLEKAREEGLPFVIDATNADDLADYRPGLRALRELGIRSPFAELGIGKEEIRRFAKALGLDNWDKPSSACLASRIPYGEEITKARLERIGKAEAALRDLGFRQIRVRDHGALARIEMDADDMIGLTASPLRDTIVQACKASGYLYVTLDLQGYRTGSMNESLGGISSQP